MRSWGSRAVSLSFLQTVSNILDNFLITLYPFIHIHLSFRCYSHMSLVNPVDNCPCPIRALNFILCARLDRWYNPSSCTQVVSVQLIIWGALPASPDSFQYDVCHRISSVRGEGNWKSPSFFSWQHMTKAGGWKLHAIMPAKLHFVVRQK